ncbi:hypothetical protein [Brevundimonas sp. DC300-4]|uniref:hypothetical protein n=1 Tax=Brevundimonas sp. DC300-4 TaxID=2804594 RepID=UPI003CF415E3
MADETKNGVPRPVLKALSDLSPHLQRVRDGKRHSDPLIRDAWEAIAKLNPGDALDLLAPHRNPVPVGRQSGTTYLQRDAPLVDELERRVAAGEDKGKVSAELAAQAHGNATNETKAKRLRRWLNEHSAGE